MTWTFVFLASTLTAFSNFFIRRSIDSVPVEQKGDPFLAQRLLASAAVVLGVNVFLHGMFLLEVKMILMGIVGGGMLGCLMWTTGRAIQEGPSALSFACINAACVAPPLLMGLAFGKDYGHDYHLINAGGALLVIIGLLWMGWEQQNLKLNTRWMQWLICAVVVHIVFLTFFQWRALLLKPDLPRSFLLPFHCDPSRADCFSLFLFFTAAAMQKFLPSSSLPQGSTVKSRQSLWIWGVLGGLINGIAGFCMLRATEVASNPSEKALLFPLYCVCLITCCNLWGKAFYEEKCNWAACFLCFVGIVIGTL